MTPFWRRAATAVLRWMAAPAMMSSMPAQGSDSINAGAGDDTLFFQNCLFGNDTIVAGDGIDTLRVFGASSANASVVDNLNGTFTINFTGPNAGSTQVTGLEWLALDDTFVRIS